MSRKRKLDFESILDEGENPLGFTAQTPNGTAHWRGTGWNDFGPYTWPQVEPDRTRPVGRSNRTGE